MPRTDDVLHEAMKGDPPIQLSWTPMATAPSRRLLALLLVENKNGKRYVSTAEWIGYGPDAEWSFGEIDGDDLYINDSALSGNRYLGWYDLSLFSTERQS